MQLLNLVKKYIIDSQIFVSVMGTLFAVFFMLEQNLFRFPTVILIFITYFSGYLYTKYQNHQFFTKILLFNIVCGIFSAVLIYLNHNEIRLLKWLIIVILGLFYNSSFLNNHIRKIPLLKVFYVGLTWALINSWLIVPVFHFEIFVISLLGFEMEFNPNSFIRSINHRESVRSKTVHMSVTVRCAAIRHQN